MNSIVALFVLALIPACATLRCYNCASGLTGCNDPFSATASNITITSSSSDTFCVKTAATSALVMRYGASTCTATGFVFGVGTACCQTDLCNGGQAKYPASILLAVTSILLMFKFY